MSASSSGSADASRDRRRPRSRTRRSASMPATRSAALAIAVGVRRVMRADPARRIAAQRHDVAHAGLPVIAARRRRSRRAWRRRRSGARPAATLVSRTIRVDRPRVRSRVDAARAVGHGDEARRERHEALDRRPERAPRPPRISAERIRTRHGCPALRPAGSGVRRRWCSCDGPVRIGGAVGDDARIAREPQRDGELVCCSPAGRSLGSSGSSPALTQPLLDDIRRRSRGGDGHGARAGIQARAARNRRSAAGRPARAARAASAHGRGRLVENNAAPGGRRRHRKLGDWTGKAYMSPWRNCALTQAAGGRDWRARPPACRARRRCRRRDRPAARRVRGCGRCRCRCRAELAPALLRTAARMAASTAASSTCSARMFSQFSACSRK